jgi:hypothetical protein
MDKPDELDQLQEIAVATLQQLGYRQRIKDWVRDYVFESQ